MTELDCRDLKCPLPVLKTEKALETLAPGDRLIVLASDPIARIDVPLYCRQKGHLCVLEEAPDGTLIFTITRARDPA